MGGRCRNPRSCICASRWWYCDQCCNINNPALCAGRCTVCGVKQPPFVRGAKVRPDPGSVNHTPANKSGHSHLSDATNPSIPDFEAHHLSLRTLKPSRPLFGATDDAFDVLAESRPDADGLEPHSIFVRPGKLLYLDIMINGLRFSSVPDSGSHINAIPLSTFKQLEQASKRGRAKSSSVSANDEFSVISVGNDTSAGALFQVQLVCCIPSVDLVPEIKISPVFFHVFERLATGVSAIVGLEFLRQTNVLTNQDFRLRERSRAPAHTPQCLSIGKHQPSNLRFHVLLNGKEFLALPDTGSEISLIHRACALQHGFPICALDVDDDENHAVEFANGEIQGISGKVLAILALSAPASVEPTSFDCGVVDPRDLSTTQISEADVARLGTFYVLDQLAHEVILGQRVLHAMDAWNRHKSAFISIKPSDAKQDLCTIFSRKRKRKGEDTRSQCLQREAVRKRNVELQREQLNRDLARADKDAARQALQQKLRELNRQDQVDRNKHEEALNGFTT
ncbi:hypothetical protein, variant [Cladophialophora immunda]|uniref:Uncharacterized protein n=1 Tax=Cladophialophora immunda TaxID=569365 RepID=A0A0D2CCJ7_9EURO|nr:uncharacterized protein PV07_04680 [Cladophialophora immunda]XP_016249030.1 hypothetical protein, variant [Cladophialophora immunda]KIW28813.1 hypothetical protein PV07_04680 [Cladophialophora immunda]KIW28814.1 hypothetical protein, variant [Cladophialophora immunda]